MPHFSWRGVTITGAYKQGILFAASADHVDQLLLRKGIACIKVKPSRRYILIQSRIGYAEQSAVLRQFATLLRAGILLPDAVALIAEYSAHPVLQEYMYQSAQRLKAGQGLREALEPKSPFNLLIMHMLHVGHESSDLARTVEVAAEYVDMQKTFYAQLRNALLMPCITGIFIIILIWAIIAFLLPHITSIFSSFQAELPYTTQLLMRVSALLRDPYIGLSIGVGLCLISALGVYVKKYSRIVDFYTLRIPYIGTLLRERLLVLSCYALASLVRSGMQLHAALDIAKNSSTHSVLQEDFRYIADQVASGASLSDACASTQHGLFSPECIAMIRVGEESNTLAKMLEVIASTSHERLSRRLIRFSSLMQPVLVILLGVVVMVLVLSIYLPIMNLADLI